MTKTGSLTVVSAFAAAALLLSGCVGSVAPDYPLLCMAEVNPPGGYGYPAGVAVPTVLPEAGGTQAGAAAVNACIQAKAAAAGKKPTAAKPRRAVVETQARTNTKTPPLRAPKPIPAVTTPAPRACSYTMVGGTGYVCDQSPMRRRN